MKNMIEFLKKTSTGAVEIYEEKGRVYLARFSHEQREAYLYKPDFYTKTFATSGIIIAFETKAKSICAKTAIEQGSSRSFFYFDTYVNGVLCDHSGGQFEKGTETDFNLNIELADGKKLVEIYFPQLACASVKDFLFDGISVSDLCGEKWRPVEKNGKRVLFFGDSITQGYDAEHPSYDYAAITARRNGYEFVNKGIGGDVHNSRVLFKDSFDPELIFVAYGTNDWNGMPTRESFVSNIKGFYEKLTSIYPTTPIVAISPVWRKDNDIERPTGDFFGIHDTICDICADFENVTVVDGMNFVGRCEELFSDKKLHPNDLGFFTYAESLCRKLIEIGFIE
ncbi:MAG: hypothetical protein E7656_03495 [Ruminococcaceae bacterium]|nr:hypothetical protein [Oscillospiraceae bacterium]